MSNDMDDDIWRGFADMLKELFLKYGSALLEMAVKNACLKWAGIFCDSIPFAVTTV